MVQGAILDLIVDQGATFRREIFWEDHNLFGWVGRFVVNKGTQVVAEGTCLLNSPKIGNIQIELTAEQTNQLKAGFYKYGLFLDSLGDTIRLLSGTMAVRGL